jgi:NTP pyrophosphatase (non-canonical NTP hydrolase)
MSVIIPRKLHHPGAKGQNLCKSGGPLISLAGGYRVRMWKMFHKKGFGLMNEIRNLMNDIVAFSEERDWDQFHSPENLAKSIVIEAGELLECYQWSSNANMQDVEEELADILNYCLQLAAKLDLDPEKIVRKKMELNAKKYPVEKSKGRSTKYDQL